MILHLRVLLAALVAVLSYPMCSSASQDEVKIEHQHQVLHPDIRKQNLVKEKLPPANGKYFLIGNMTVYETCHGMKSSMSLDLSHSAEKTVLILIYDIFGFHPHNEYIADRIAEKVKVCVVIPDFFNGKPFPIEKYPPRDPRILTKFTRQITYEKVVRPNLKKVVNYYKSTREISKFGSFGYCWGAEMSPRLVSDPEFINDFKASGSVHPSSIQIKAANIVHPVVLLPSKDDANLVPFCRLINRKLGPHSCKHKRFTDMNHGFAGGLSDWTQLRIKVRVEEHIDILNEFFQRKLLNKTYTL